MSPQAKAILLAVLAGVYLTPAHALAPPVRYRCVPDAPPKVVRVVHIGDVCQDQHQKYGCAMKRDGHWWIAISTNLPKGWYRGVLEHEIAHVCGWPGDHPP